MTIQYKRGDLLQEDVEALVNTVNCVGVMGRGLALQFKYAFPKNFSSYKEACKNEKVKLGHMFVFETQETKNPRWIINFPTKKHWRGASRMEDIVSGLRALMETVKQRDIRSIAIPSLGCGLGGLPWEDVKREMEAALRSAPGLHAVIFEPHETHTEPARQPNGGTSTLTLGRAILVGFIHRYLGAFLDPFLTLLEIHKLMYFMQEAGEPLRLKFTQAIYGPYAENLRHVLRVMEGAFIQGYTDGGDAPEQEISLTPDAATQAMTLLKEYPDTLARFERVLDLIEGFESSFGLELLSTIHWILKRGSARSFEEVVQQTHAWNSRKQIFSPRQISLAVARFRQKSWLPPDSPFL